MADRPTCVYCRQRPAVARWRPFCSERCRMADLGRWLNEEYRIPGDEVDEDPLGGAAEDEEAPRPSRR